MEVDLEPNGGGIIRKDLLDQCGLLNACGEDYECVIRILKDRVISLSSTREGEVDSALSEHLINCSLE